MNALAPSLMASLPPAVLRPLLRWLGGKFRLAKWIIEHFPAHDIYCEPYGGAASVMLVKEPAYNEIYNDLDDELVNLFRVLRGEAAAELIWQIAMTPYAQREYEAARVACEDAVERARRMLVRSHLGHGTGGARIDRPTGFRSNGLSGSTNVAGEWADFPSALAAIAMRLKDVEIVSRPAIELVEKYGDPRALVYLDPPYMPDTRSTKSRKPGERYHTYSHEMSEADHADLLGAACASRGMVLISGYASELYEKRLQGWRRVDKAARAHRNSPRTEILWINPLAAERLGPGKLL